MTPFDHSRFYRHAELLALLRERAAACPRYLQLLEIGRSHEGREIVVVALTDSETGPADDKPALWVDGNIHSVELSASTACLYLIDWLLKGVEAGHPEILRALRTRAFYVCPRVNPDGAELALADRPRFVRSGTRNWPWPEDPVSGLVMEDIDGDGRILQMRVADPNGPFKRHPDEPRLLVRREPTDAGGEYFRVMPEGRLIDYDGTTLQLVGNAGNAAGLDLNRNFPANWRQEHEQVGAGPFPTSEPEIRAIVAFFTTHRNICAGVAFHTYSGVLLRPFADRPDDKLPAHDLWVYQKIGRKGEELTGYPAISVFHDYAYMPGEHIGGSFDWIYEHLGLYTWTVELWNPKKAAGIDNQEWIHWFRDHPPADDLQMLNWSDTQLGGVGHVDWYPVDHPQLGRVELGGWNRFAAFSNPPPHLREREVARFAPWLLYQALVTPRLELREALATRVDTDTWAVRFVVQNSGWLPSHVSRMALDRKQTRGVFAEIGLPSNACLATGQRRVNLGELAGWSHRHTGITFWPDRKPSDDRAHADWVVKAPAGTTVTLAAWHERAGRVETRVTLG